MYLFRGIVLFFVLCPMIGCGSGGGSGSDYVGGANVSISVEPQEVDTGDQVLVSVGIGDVHPDGIALKIRYPQQLSFVTASALLEINGQRTLTSPDFEESSATGAYTYLVFLLDQPLLIERGGSLTFELRALGQISKGEIGVDADINTGEFDSSAPQFSAQDSVLVTIDADR